MVLVMRLLRLFRVMCLIRSVTVLVWLIMVVRVVICLVFVFMIRVRGCGRSRILWMHLWIRLMRIGMPMLVGTRWGINEHPFFSCFRNNS